LKTKNFSSPTPLKARAIGFLSRREYTRFQLKRKLLTYTDETQLLEALLDDLEQQGWLSTQRFVEGWVQRRASRQGTARLVQELRQQGVNEEQLAELKNSLQETEYERAHALCQKRYGQPPSDRSNYAKQGRFLARCGFTLDTIQRVLAGKDFD
jgi:regulatory protein